MATRNTKGKTSKPYVPLYNQGDVVKKIRAVIPVVAAWNDGDVVILAYNLPVDAVITRINLPNGSPGITGSTDWDFGFYKAAGANGQSLGDVIDKDALVDGVSFASARTAAIDILGSNITLDKSKTIGELLPTPATNESAPVGGIHLCATANTVGSADGDIDVEIEYIDGH